MIVERAAIESVACRCYLMLKSKDEEWLLAIDTHGNSNVRAAGIPDLPKRRR